MRILLATTNRHKAREIAAILEPLGFAVETPERLPPVVEDGDTFAANAEKKAASAAKATGIAYLADDSGLVAAQVAWRGLIDPGAHAFLAPSVRGVFAQSALSGSAVSRSPNESVSAPR